MDIETLPDMLRVEEAAAVLRISRSSAYDEVALYQRTGGREGLPSIRVGSRSLARSEGGAAAMDRREAQRC